MLQTLAALIYITMLCGTWGYLLLEIFAYLTGDKEVKLYNFPLTCFTGMAVVAVLSGLMSLLIPLGGVSAQVILLIPALAAWMSSRLRSNFLLQLKILTGNYSPATVILLLSLFALILVISPYIIHHPDTLGYHAQTIKWIQEYKAIPGLVHLQTRYGYQGLWYCLCAVFGFRFTGTAALTFVNAAVVFWFFLFVLQNINASIFKTGGERNRAVTGLLLLLLLAFTLWDYGQVRLTLSSATADFIAALFVTLVFYLFLVSNDQRLQTYLLIIFLVLTGITIKLSTLPVALIPLFIIIRFIRLNKYKLVSYSVILFLMVLAPFISRNIISSGYIAFPSTIIDITDRDWKFDMEATALEKKYITAYARVGEVTTREEIEAAYAMNTASWLPVWWKHLSNTHKSSLILLAFLLVMAIFHIRSLIETQKSTWRFAFITAIAGLIFWFTQAPDPRFGYGFIVSFQGMMIFYLSERHQKNIKINKALLNYAVYLLSIAIFMYTGYRLVYYFDAANMIHASGLRKIPFNVIECSGVKFNQVKDTTGCGSTPTPCIQNNCNGFQLRTGDIQDGFRAASSAVK